MKEFLKKPSTLALIDTVVFLLIVVGVPAIIARIFTFMGVDPMGGLLLILGTMALWIFYTARLEKRQADASSTESDDQPLNS